VSSKLLLRSTQLATSESSIPASGCSKLLPSGSRWVAGWVAGGLSSISLTYAAKSFVGSRGSRFLKNFRMREEKKRRIGITIEISCYTCYPSEYSLGRIFA
jgi:hypothetical protein